ncbi:DUF4259 domain-containing protein [Streptomyces avicenniae]|uniref:DUF4259 domain-containing protein n=1 Tax=Streptomyces avicenniae TaxID=500153 RepID=UPI00069C0944|nr:DUF4259 domain-containing protein [Streptomyces avicenniae]
MGTWGSGNFDNDTAGEYLAGVVGRLVDEVAEAMAGDPVGIEPDEYWGVVVPCNVELLTALADAGHGAGSLPTPAVVEEWRRAYIDVWERTIDELEPTPGHRAERRAILDRTFEGLARAAAAGG